MIFFSWCMMSFISFSRTISKHKGYQPYMIVFSLCMMSFISFNTTISTHNGYQAYIFVLFAKISRNLLIALIFSLCMSFISLSLFSSFSSVALVYSLSRVTNPLVSFCLGVFYFLFHSSFFSFFFSCRTCSITFASSNNVFCAVCLSFFFW